MGKTFSSCGVKRILPRESDELEGILFGSADEDDPTWTRPHRRAGRYLALKGNRGPS